MNHLAPPIETLPFVHDLFEGQLRALQEQAAQAAGLPSAFRDPMKSGGEGPEMVIIPAGVFDMGSDTREAGHQPEEAPLHVVHIARPFAMGRYPVTGEEFERFANTVGWRQARNLLWAGGRYPAINIRIADAETFIEWLNGETGASYRLPTEAEWEYAARAGTRTAFHFGDEATCREIFSSPLSPYEKKPSKRRFFMPRCAPLVFPMEVGQKEPNVWGLHDMHGNVWEFTADSWTDSHAGARTDGASPSADPKWIVIKGGSWFDPPAAARSASRRRRLRDELDINIGFRLVRDLR